MTFKDIYKKYKDGTASDKEKLQVLEELEKYKTLTDDYLNDQSDDLHAEIQGDNITEFDIDNGEIKAIKERERWKNIKLVLISVIIICVLLAVYKFAITPLLNKYVFFDPYKSTFSTSGNFSDLEIELETFTSLHAPFVKISNVDLENTGLGKYDLTLQLVNSDDLSNPKDEHGYIRNGKVKLEPFAETTTLWAGYFDVLRTGGYTQKEINEHNEAEFKKLNDLQSNFTAARVAITLKDEIDMNLLAEYIRNYDDLIFEWTAIVSNETRTVMPLLGMDLRGSAIMISEDDKAKDGDYPGFTEMEYTKEGLENHFMKMLEFQNDNPDLVNRLLDTKNTETIGYDGIINYMNENGIKSYGLIVKGKPSDIIEFYNSASTIDITVRDVMLDVG